MREGKLKGREGKGKRMRHKQYLVEIRPSRVKEYRRGHTSTWTCDSHCCGHDSRLRPHHSAFSIRRPKRSITGSHLSTSPCPSPSTSAAPTIATAIAIPISASCPTNYSAGVKKRISTSELTSKPKRTVLLAECQMFAFF